MSKGRNVLGAVTLIISLAGLSFGLFSFFSMNQYINIREIYISPKARVYYEGPIYSIPDGGGPLLFNYTHINYDTHGAFDLDTDSYLIPETGYYQITAQYSIDAIDGGFFVIFIYSNDIVVCTKASTCSVNTNVFGVAITDIRYFGQGDSISIRAYQSDPGTSARDIFDGEDHTFFAIAKIP